MKLLIVSIIWIVSLAASGFKKYNSGVVQNQEWPDEAKTLIKQVIDQADAFEQLPESHEKLILYHGETIYGWIWQLVAKAFLYPESWQTIEDWLPMRYSKRDRSNVIGESLLKLSKASTAANLDHTSAYRNIGMALTCNLVSDQPSESGVFALLGFSPWYSADGISFVGPPNIRKHFAKAFSVSFLKMKKVVRQVKAILTFIQQNRNLLDIYQNFASFEQSIGKPFQMNEYKALFPSLTNNELEYVTSKSKSPKKHEGVVLQVVMNPIDAVKLCYVSTNFGKPSEQIKDLVNFYKETKNNKEITTHRGIKIEQIRCAVGQDMVRNTEKVRIKALTPITQDKDAMNVLNKMIQDMSQAYQNSVNSGDLSGLEEIE